MLRSQRVMGVVCRVRVPEWGMRRVLQLLVQSEDKLREGQATPGVSAAVHWGDEEWCQREKPESGRPCWGNRLPDTVDLSAGFDRASARFGETVGIVRPRCRLPLSIRPQLMCRFQLPPKNANKSPSGNYQWLFLETIFQGRIGPAVGKLLFASARDPDIGKWVGVQVN